MNTSNLPATSSSNRILATPSSYAKANYLYAQEAGTLTSLRPHISQRERLNSYLIMIVTKGSGFFTYGNEKRNLSAGACVFIDCHSEYSHESSAENPWTLDWVHFEGKEAKSWYLAYCSSGFPYLFHPENPEAFSDTILQIHSALNKADAMSELNVHFLINHLIHLCFLAGQKATLTLSHQAESELTHKLSLAREYIINHCDKPLNLDLLSEVCYLSKFHLAREYHRFYGVTIVKDITFKRIARAKSLLRFSSDSIESIALSCGFQDAGYFSKVFRKSEGISPKEYRNKW